MLLAKVGRIILNFVFWDEFSCWFIEIYVDVLKDYMMSHLYSIHVEKVKSHLVMFIFKLILKSVLFSRVFWLFLLVLCMYFMFLYMSLLYSSGFLRSNVIKIMQTDLITNIDI